MEDKLDGTEEVEWEGKEKLETNEIRYECVQPVQLSIYNSLYFG